MVHRPLNYINQSNYAEGLELSIIPQSGKAHQIPGFSFPFYNEKKVVTGVW